jgi:hypothetical protein
VVTNSGKTVNLRWNNETTLPISQVKIRRSQIVFTDPIKDTWHCLRVESDGATVHSDFHLTAYIMSNLIKFSAKKIKNDPFFHWHSPENGLKLHILKTVASKCNNINSFFRRMLQRSFCYVAHLLRRGNNAIFLRVSSLTQNLVDRRMNSTFWETTVNKTFKWRCMYSQVLQANHVTCKLTHRRTFAHDNTALMKLSPKKSNVSSEVALPEAVW